jgi:hypothetical protein
MLGIMMVVVFFGVLGIVFFAWIFSITKGVSRDIMNAHDDRVDRKLAEQREREEHNG